MESASARPIAPLPKSLIRLRDGRVVPRRSGFLRPGDALRCPFGHSINPMIALHEGAATITCKVRQHDVSPYCGCLLYVSTGTMGFHYVDVTKDEDEERERLGIKPIDMPRFLGIDFPK